MESYLVRRHIANGQVKISFAGIDMHGLGDIVAEQGDVLVVKFPAGKHWSGRFMPAAYHSPSIYVLQKRQDKSGRYNLVINYDVTRPKKSAKLS